MGRKDRVKEIIKQEVSSIIHDEVNDPRIGFVTVTRIEMSPDLRYATIFVSVLGQPKECEETFKALNSAKGFIRKLLAGRIRMRFIPDISFKQDKTIEYSVYISKKIDEIKDETKNEDS